MKFELEEIVETISMVAVEHFDVRTVTLASWDTGTRVRVPSRSVSLTAVGRTPTTRP